MKKPVILISLVLGSILVIFGLLWMWNSNSRVGGFSLDEYQEIMTEHSSELVVGEVKSANEAMEVALHVWKDIYGANIIFRIPFRVFFDNNHQVWLVRGSVLFQESGPCILISKQDGKVLAVWDYQF